MKNSKIANIALILAVLTLLFSTIAFARPYTDIFTNGLLRINSFFESEQYAPYSKAIDFFFFALLFTAVYMMGARYAFKEMKRPEQVIVILLGLMTAFLMVLADISATFLLPYIHWLFYVLLFMLYWWLLKGIQNKFWRFLLALLLTILTIMLIMGLFRLAKPEISGPVFGDFFKGFGRISLPTGIGLPSYLRDFFGIRGEVPSVTGPITETVTPPEIREPEEEAPAPPPPGEKPCRIAGMPCWLFWILLLLVIFGLGYLVWRNRDKLKRKPKEPEGPPEEIAIEKIIEEILKIIELKQKILKKANDILKRKQDATSKFWDVYHKLVNDPKFDPAFLLDKESDIHKKFMEENKEVAQLVIWELELEKDLIELREIEEELTGAKGTTPEQEGFFARWKAKLRIKKPKKIPEKGKLETWLETIDKHYVGREPLKNAPDAYRIGLEKIHEAFDKLHKNGVGVIPEINQHIITYLMFTKKEEDIEQKLKELTDLEKIEKWLRQNRFEKWREFSEKEGKDLKDYFEKEEFGFFESYLKPKVNLEMRLLQGIVQLLKYLESEKKSFTRLQELHVEVKDPANPEKWVEVTEQATKEPGIKLQPFRIYTNFASGIPPFKVGCYVNNTKKSEKPIEKKYDIEPVVQFTSEELGISSSGVYKIDVIAISAKDTYRRMSRKSIMLYLRGEEYPPKEYPPSEYPKAEYPPKEYPPSQYPKVEYPPKEYPPREYPSKEYPSAEYPHREYPPTPSAMKDVSEGGQLHNHFDFFRGNASIQISKSAFPSLKILHLSIPRDIKAGVVTAVDNLVNYEKEYGMYVQLINHWWNKDVYIVNGRKITTQSSPYVFIGNINISTKNMQNIPDILTKSNFVPDVIHVHTHTFEYDGALKFIRNAFQSAPVAYTLHQLIPHAYMTSSEKNKLGEFSDEDVLDIIGRYYSRGYEGRNKGQADTIRVSDGIIAISSSQLTYFEKLFKNYKGERVAIENGVDFFKFINHSQIDAKGFELLSKHNLAGYRVMLFVGRIEEAKGYQRTLKAFLKLLGNPKYRNSKLVFVGGYAPGIESKIAREVPKEILKENVIFTPWIKDHLELAAWYRIGTALVNPMFTDNLYSMAAKEAVCLGLPVIACKGDMSIGQSRTDEDIYKALVYIFENQEEVKAHLLRAFEICLRYHSVYASIEEHLKFYNKLIEKKNEAELLRRIHPAPPAQRATPEMDAVLERARTILNEAGLMAGMRRTDALRLGAKHGSTGQAKNNPFEAGTADFQAYQAGYRAGAGAHGIAPTVPEAPPEVHPHVLTPPTPEVAAVKPEAPKPLPFSLTQPIAGEAVAEKPKSDLSAQLDEALGAFGEVTLSPADEETLRKAGILRRKKPERF